jgi:nucleoid DNA-binding protein/ABC-type molybdate transport system substrate-binding protein
LDLTMRGTSPRIRREAKMTTRPKIAAALAGCLGAAVAATAANAAEVSLLSSTAMREVLEELVPAFERASGHKVAITFQSGVNVSARIREGAIADVVITTGTALDELAKEGKVVAGSRVDFVRARVGAAVRAGAPKPDIGTPETFKNALLAAKSIGYSRGPSGVHFESVMKRLGIFDQVKGKLIQPELGVRVGALVAKGDAEIGVQQRAHPDRRHRFHRPVAERAADGAGLFDRAARNRQGAGGRQGAGQVPHLGGGAPGVQEIGHGTGLHARLRGLKGVHAPGFAAHHPGPRPAPHFPFGAESYLSYGSAFRASREASIMAPNAAAKPSRPVTLKHLAATLAEDHQMTKRAGEALLGDLVGLITKHLKKGERIKISGLGILQVRKRAARMGRNPATGEAIKIKASRKVAFRAAKDLKMAI